MKIALVDNEKAAQKELLQLLGSRLPDGTHFDCFDSGEEFLNVWRRASYDLVVLDIFMKEMTGVEVAQRIRRTDQEVHLVFATSSNDFAGESYEVNACYYLRKPFTPAAVDAMLTRLNPVRMEQTRRIRLPDGQSIFLGNIAYVDFSSHCVIFHVMRGTDVVSRIPFAEVEPLLCAYPNFFCSSRGYIVNFDEVAMQREGAFLLRDGTQIPISRRKAKEALEAWASFRFARLREGVSH